MAINGSAKNFLAALGTLGVVGGGVWTGIDAVRATYAAEAMARQALDNSQRALDKTEGIDVVQEKLQNQGAEIDEIQRQLLVIKSEQARKLNKIIEKLEEEQ
jgi:hypothetical protein